MEDCEEKKECLYGDIVCKIKDISCRITSYECVGRPVKDLWSRVSKLQNIKWVIDNLSCELTCEEVESFRCIVTKIKG